MFHYGALVVEFILAYLGLAALWRRQRLAATFLFILMALLIVLDHFVIGGVS